MRTQKMRHFGKTVVASIAAFMMLAESFTVSACSADFHAEAEECAAEEQSAVGKVLYDAQFVDEDGNIYPVSEISPQVFCISHRKVDGYYETHVADGKGGCTVKIYYSVKCVICSTIWVGDWKETIEYAKCPH